MAERPLVDIEETLNRICGEYLEMPGLRLTSRQAQRLWGLDEPTCERLLGVLLDGGFLYKTRDHTFARATEGSMADLPLRMAKAELPSVPPVASIRSSRGPAGRAV